MNTFGFGRGGNCTTHSQGSQTFSILISDYVIYMPSGNVLTSQLTGGCQKQIMYHVIINLRSFAVRLPWAVGSYPALLEVLVLRHTDICY